MSNNTMMMMISGTVIPSGVEISARGTILVPVNVNTIMKEGYIPEMTVTLEMNISRYNRLFKGTHGSVTLEVNQHEFDGTQVAGVTIRTFVVLGGGEPVACPEVKDLIADYRDKVAVLEAVGGEKIAIDEENKYRDRMATAVVTKEEEEELP